jgi:hypothetical protein
MPQDADGSKPVPCLSVFVAGASIIPTRTGRNCATLTGPRPIGTKNYKKILAAPPHDGLSSATAENIRLSGALLFWHGQCSVVRVESKREHTDMTMKKFGTLMIGSALIVSVAGCSGAPLTTREKGTLIGGGAGAVGGTLVGAAVGHPGAGAAIGGLGGAAAGYAIGNHEQNEQYRRYGD